MQSFFFFKIANQCEIEEKLRINNLKNMTTYEVVIIVIIIVVMIYYNTNDV
jgi:hypothetical protein